MLRQQSNAGRVVACGEGLLSRSEFLRLGGMGLVGMAAAGAPGCGGEEGGDSGNVIFSYWPGPAVMHRIVEKFNEQKRGKFKVTYQEIPWDYSQYHNKLKTEFQAGGGKIDVPVADVIWTGEFAENGWIADLSDRFAKSERSEFLPGPIASLTYEGKIYGIPFKTDAGMLYYRKDLLEQSGFSEPPRTWDQLKEIAEKVQQDSGTRYGLVFQGADYEGGVCNALEYIWTHGGEVLEGDNVIINSPESVAGLTTEQSMVTDGVAPQAVASFMELESETTFRKGDAVFCRNWPYMFGLLSDSDSDVKPEQVGVSALPVGEGQSKTTSAIGGENMLINASSEVLNEAWEFIRFLTSEESQTTYAEERTELPSLKTLYDDRHVQEVNPLIALGQEALLNARSRPVSPYYTEMSLKMSKQYNNVLRGATSPEQAVETLQRELQQIIEQGQ